MDAVNFLKAIRLSKLLYKAMLTQKQRILYQFQRQNLIESGSSAEQSDYSAMMRDMIGPNLMT